MRINNISFSVQFLIILVIWLCGFLLGFNFPEDYSSQSTNVLIDSAPNLANFSNEDLFIHILEANSKVILLNASGYVLIGIPPVIACFYNGFVTSLELNKAASKIGWKRVFLVSYTHAMELIGIWLGGAIGLRGVGFTLNIINGEQPRRRELSFIMTWLLIAFLLIVIAAYIESFISII